jgi:DNA polymerase I-like protein with 3'-5' exonuclease and polymerase domains
MSKPDFYTLDFETYYDKVYSLSKMTTQEYVMDSRFEIIGVGIAKNGEPPVWYSFSSYSGIGFDLTEYAEVLNPLHGQVVLAHNATFDMGILAYHFDIHPAVILDTLSMARPLHGSTVGGSLKALAVEYKLGEKGTEVVAALGKRRADMLADGTLDAYGEYCKNDVALTRDLYKRLAKETSPLELKVIDRTIRMATQSSLLLDTEMLVEALKAERTSMQSYLERAGVPREFVMSNQKLAALLEALGVTPPTKTSPTTGEETLAMAKSDAAFVALENHNIPLVRNLVSARLANKSTINATRMEKFLHLSTFGPLWVPLNYCGATTTWRWSGADGLNLQNLPSRGGNNLIRRAIMAPPGHKLVVVDSSNIELRVNHTLAGQEDVVQALREGRDLYKEFAANSLYNIPLDAVTKEQRFIGKVAHLLLGYQGGWKKFQDMARIMGVEIPDDEAEHIVNTWRSTYSKVKALWRDAERLIDSMITGFPYALASAGFVSSTKNKLNTPPNHYIKYPDLKETDDGYTYKSRRGRGTETVYLYGGKLVENLCIAEGTPVYTDKGWVSIDKVTEQHKVFDGVEFVTHGGLLFKGNKQCITVDSTYMTANHEVLTNEGWQEASQLQRPDGPKIRYVDRDPEFAQQWEELGVGLPMFLWEQDQEVRQGRIQGDETGRHSELRLFNQNTSEQTENTRHEPPSGLLGLAFNVRQVPASLASSVAQLRSAWRNRVRRVGAIFRGFLEGHGGHLPEGAYSGQSGQLEGVLQGELSVGYTKDAEQQSPGQLTSRHSSCSQVNRSTALDARVSMAPRPVYDILNAGQRQRFVVAGASGPFIVHNCQHISRNILAEQFATISDRYTVAMMVHDEFVLVVPDEDAEEALRFSLDVMSTSPSWWPEIPLAAEGDIADRYGDAK